jgi:tRNA(Ile)-lysidine synthase
VDVAALAATRRQSLESAARDLRYAAFTNAARAMTASRVATGHTQDDQAETVLLRLLRGTTARGLGGIRPRRGIFIRPLLECTRTELRDELAQRAEPFRDDRSNLDVSIPRNRLRREVLPVVLAAWPRASAAMARFAELAADDESLLSRMAEEVAPRLSLSAPDGVQLDVRGLGPVPPALSRRMIRAAIERAGGVPVLRDIEAVLRLARADKLEGTLDLRGLVVTRRGAVLAFGQAAKRRRPEPFELVLPVPGEVKIRETGAVLRASMQVGAPPDLIAAGSVAVFPARAISLPLIVRNRRAGDRIHPLGAAGSRKLQDVFVDRKVPRADRDELPIVTDANGQIVWVPGLVVSESCRVTAPETDVVVLKMTKETL